VKKTTAKKPAKGRVIRLKPRAKKPASSRRTLRRAA
jgi:hypothetical protein